MNKTLKQKTGFAIFWSFIDKGGQQAIQLIFGIVLARILFPSEIGLFALLAIFTSAANILQESGFSAALIRKDKPEEEDFSSVFYFNISISIFIYAILFLGAPLISWFYENPILTALSRVVFLSFVFNAFAIIQNVTLVIKMDFKTNTKITLTASSIAGIVAITSAYYGMGVWSLALQLVLQTFLRSVLLWLLVKWRPTTSFSSYHLKKMMPYSMKLLATSVMNQICSNLYTNIIGKHFNSSQAGVYSQANKFSIIPQSVISDGIRSAAFPALAKIKDDVIYTKKAFRKVMRITAFISFPIALIIIITAKPIILLLLTDKWQESIPILQILAVGAAFYPLYTLIATLLQTIGKTGLIFKLESFRNILALALILVTIKYGVHGLVAGMSLTSTTAFFVGIIIAGRHINYSLTEIIKDIAPYGLIAFISIAPFFFLPLLGLDNLLALLVIPSLVGTLIYLTILKVLGSVILHDSISFFKQQLSKLKK